MVEETNQSESFQQLISVLHLGNHIDEMTKTWICHTPEPPHIPISYTLTKIHKLTPVGRPVVSGSDGLVATKKLSSFVYILQPTAQQRKSNLKDTTHLINFLEKTKVPENTILVSIDVTSLHANIPEQEGINVPVPSQLQQLKRIEKCFNSNNYLERNTLTQLL